MAKIFAFSSQKGGPGKTTLTQLLATYFNAKKMKVMVIDADVPQHSYSATRVYDLRRFSKEIEQHNIVPYPIKELSLGGLSQVIEDYKNNPTYDIIFLDLPGTLNLEAYKKIAIYLDAAIIPMELEFKSYQSAMMTVDFFEQHSPSTKLGAIWNKLEHKHNKEVREKLTNHFKSRNVYTFAFNFSKTVTIGHRINTIFPLTDVIETFAKEFQSSGLLN